MLVGGTSVLFQSSNFYSRKTGSLDVKLKQEGNGPWDSRAKLMISDSS